MATGPDEADPDVDESSSEESDREPGEVAATEPAAEAAVEYDVSSDERTWAILVHASAFAGFFIPFGNILGPLLVWAIKKDESRFVDENGTQALNFQISIFLYFILLVSLGIAGVVFLGFRSGIPDSFPFTGNISSLSEISFAIPLIIYVGVIGLLLLALFILEIFAVITATIKANEGSLYQYPLTINFISPTPVGKNQSENEQFNNTQNQTL
jgi:uncharacterized Tic20 family protein